MRVSVNREDYHLVGETSIVAQPDTNTVSDCQVIPSQCPVTGNGLIESGARADADTVSKTLYAPAVLQGVQDERSFAQSASLLLEVREPVGPADARAAVRLEIKAAQCQTWI